MEKSNGIAITQPTRKHLKKIGALWKRAVKETNREYFSGEINGQKVLIFSNQRKAHDKHPDFHVLAEEPVESKK